MDTAQDISDRDERIGNKGHTDKHTEIPCARHIYKTHIYSVRDRQTDTPTVREYEELEQHCRE